jgi:hypothetical protein
MKTDLLTFCLALATATLASPRTAGAADSSQPHLEMRHGATQLIVDGNPFLVLGGELHNSSTSSKAYMQPIWPQLVQRNFNTALAVITWELIEPQPGRFDFTTVDDTIQGARQNHLHLVILWFGSWKNGESSYQPSWVKADPRRYPWVKDRDGKTLNVLSTFGEATRDADARAFAALMRHIREVDGKDHTVLMMQVENEVGVLGDSRDHVPAANEAYARPVPADLMSYLVQHKATLAPELLQVWTANGSKTSGTWAEVFGPGKPQVYTAVSNMTTEEYNTTWKQFNWASDEIFMAWRYSSYINKVAGAGKAEYNIPMFVNTWLQKAKEPRPGEFPSGCPEPEVHDIWKCCAPNIDILAPDIYDPYFTDILTRYTRQGKPLFIPEVQANATNALIAIFQFNSIGFSPFGIDSGRPDAVSQTYAVLDRLAPVILDNQGKGAFAMLKPMRDTNEPPQEVKLGDYTVKIAYTVPGRRGGAPAAPAAESVPPNGFPYWVVINSGPGEYWIVGGPMTVGFTPNTPTPGAVVLRSLDESVNVDGRWLPGRRLNGDETGNNVRWAVPSFGIWRYTIFQRE